jgi:hypothetical protein
LVNNAADVIVRNEVIYCVSSLVATLAAHIPAANSATTRNSSLQALATLCEQACELAMPVVDYEEAAIQAGWAYGGDFDGCWYNKAEFGSWKAAATAEDAVTYASAEDVCAHEGLDPYPREVYEHWIVTDWLAGQLEALGERVDRDFAGLNVWARTTTGQSITLDAAIGAIAHRHR